MFLSLLETWGINLLVFPSESQVRWSKLLFKLTVTCNSLVAARKPQACHSRMTTFPQGQYRVTAWRWCWGRGGSHCLTLITLLCYCINFIICSSPCPFDMFFDILHLPNYAITSILLMPQCTAELKVQHVCSGDLNVCKPSNTFQPDFNFTIKIKNLFTKKCKRYLSCLID